MQGYYFIGKYCIQCTMCINYCPVHAISIENGAFVIQSDICIRCGKCAKRCRARAISWVSDHIATEKS